MQRIDFQKLAQLRIREARCLLAAGFYDGAFYIAGYAIECALKACISKRVERFEYPPKDVRDHYSHNLRKLAELAKVDNALENGTTEIAANWAIVLKWKEQERYNLGIDENRARQLIASISDKRDGVLTCLRKLW